MDTIYVLGAGAVGFPLAAYLAQAGRKVIAVRTSRADVSTHSITITILNGPDRFSVPISEVSLAQLPRLDGMIVVASKSYANGAIASALREKAPNSPIVIMQNGIGVEKPFAEFTEVYRCVLYMTSQPVAANEYAFRPVTQSPIGSSTGSAAGLEQVVAAVTTDGFPFRSEANIQREIWKKAIINSVFNSICPLIDIDNGVFTRDQASADLARSVVRECIMLTERLQLGLGEQEIMDQIMMISQRSNGQLISTLQDLRAGRTTEIEFLNLEIARTAASLNPPLALPQVELLGKMIAITSALGNRT